MLLRAHGAVTRGRGLGSRSGRRGDLIPRGGLEQQLQHVAEVLAALHAQLVGKTFDRRGPHACDLGGVDPEQAAEVLVGHTPAQGVVEHLSVPGIEAGEGLGELFAFDHGRSSGQALGLREGTSRAVQGTGWS